LVSGSVKRILGNSSTVLHCSSLFFNIMNTTLFYFNILIMTMLYLFMFAIILFLVYRSYTLGLVRLELYTCLGSYSVYPSDPWVNDKYCVGVVLRPYLSAIAPYMPDRGVVRDGDSFVGSYIVPLPCVRQAEQHYYGGVIAMFLIFLDNITMHGRSPFSQ
jgi:hypothetical protein